ncbi:MAG: lipid-A-disaccharide synthase [Gammaproteobacteria bacterium]|nr:lipid-A-disaccharide synthase [Gammaproteobacteria bacterium]
MLSIGLVAGETSGDRLGADFMRAVLARRPDTHFYGIAGPQMAAAGCEVLAGADSLAVMGLFEVLRHLPHILAVRRRVLAEFLGRRPDVFVGIDAPEFNLGLAGELRAAGIRTVQYVSPQVWAWRRGRVRAMARNLDSVLCLLPFEQRFYEGQGLAASFVGHPLADRMPLEPDRMAARAMLGIHGHAPVLAVLPGSRLGEVERLADPFARTLRQLAQQRPMLQFVAPMARPAVREVFAGALQQLAPGVAVRLLDGQAGTALAAADAALVASGTATLETLLCKRPMVVAYRVAALTAGVLRLFRLMKAPFIAQPNLLAGRQVVEEYVQDQVQPAVLVPAVCRALDDDAHRRDLEQLFHKLHLDLRRNASERAADAVLALASRAARVPATGAPR